MSLPRIALLGAPAQCLAALCEAGHPVLMVTPPLDRRARLARHVGRGRFPIEAEARRFGVPVAHYDEEGGCESALRDFRPDLVCMAVFPKRLPARLASIGRLGAINLHSALLPRHRGPNPTFWTYYHGDRESGWTAHRPTEQFDQGPILLQESFDVPRGMPVARYRAELLGRVGPFLLRAIAAVAAGAPERAQDEALATRAPRVDLASFSIPFDEWDVEQVWHFLAAYAGEYRPRLTDDLGRRVRFDRVPSFERGPVGVAGTVVRDGAAWRLNCRNGVVRLMP